MRAEAESLQRIFQGEIRYVVPLYQRTYRWRYVEDDPEKDRLGPFWDDVRQTVDRLVAYNELLASAGGDATRVAPMASHFYGAVVIDQPERSPNGVTEYAVIDGQQRLTTAQILITACADACETHGRPRHASRLRRLCRQDADLELEGIAALKLSPTRADRDSFEAVINADSTGTGLVADAYGYFAEQIELWVKDLPNGREDEHFNALRDTINDHLLFVLIELQAGDNPQGIFESLNAQGERLLAIDLVKNQVYRRSSASGVDLGRLDEREWIPRFGQPWWREEIKQGRYKRPRAELFLMHWLTERTGTETSATGLFQEFDEIFAPQRVTNNEVRPFVDAFFADADRYAGFDDYPTETRERLFSDRRQALDVGVVFPILLRLQRARDRGGLAREDFVRALLAVESWLVRRMSMRLTTANYNRVVLECLRAMDAGDQPVDALISQLASYSQDTPSSWWPDDEEWRRHLTERPLYNWLTPARLRFLLEAAEARLMTPKTERVQFAERLTIEHVIPRSWNAAWPLPDDADDAARDRRVRAVHRLGNLTLVTGRLNPALSNDPWQAKRAELQKHSSLRLNARLVAEHPEFFDEDVVDARGLQLADLLIAEWPRPA